MPDQRSSPCSDSGYSCPWGEEPRSEDTLICPSPPWTEEGKWHCLDVFSSSTVRCFQRWSADCRERLYETQNSGIAFTEVWKESCLSSHFVPFCEGHFSSCWTSSKSTGVNGKIYLLCPVLCCSLRTRAGFCAWLRVQVHVLLVSLRCLKEELWLRSQVSLTCGQFRQLLPASSGLTARPCFSCSVPRLVWKDIICVIAPVTCLVSSCHMSGSTKWW